MTLNDWIRLALAGAAWAAVLAGARFGARAESTVGRLAGCAWLVLATPAAAFLTYALVLG